MKLGIADLKTYEFNPCHYVDAMMHLQNPNLMLHNWMRTKIMKLMMEFMYDNNFIHPPVYMFSSLTDPLNHETYPAKIDYYGKELSINQSLIFHKMAIVSCSPIKRAFWFSPNIRLESDTNGAKYATEFTQMDFEVHNWSDGDASDLVHKLLGYILSSLDLEDKCDVQKITNLEREAYDYFDDEKNLYSNFDFEVNGLEVCSGAKREWEHDRLMMRMEKLGYPLEYFRPILTMAKDGFLKPSAGAGIGVERLTRALLGIEDLSKIYPFPRRPKEEIFL